MDMKSFITRKLIGFSIGLTIFFVCITVLLVLINIDIENKYRLPIYDNAREVSIYESLDMTNNRGDIVINVYVMSFWTEDSPQEIFQFYQERLTRQGWEIENISATRGRMILYRDQNGVESIEGLLVSAGYSERPKLLHVTLTMGNYESMRRLNIFGGSLPYRKLVLV